MNKITKSLIAFVALMCFGIMSVNAKMINGEKIHEIAVYDDNGEPVNLNAFVYKNGVYISEFYLSDLLAAEGNGNILYMKRANGEWVNYITGATYEAKDLEFDIEYIIGDSSNEDFTVTNDSELYNHKDGYITSEEYIDGRFIDKFKNEKELKAEQPSITLDTTAFTSKLEQEFGFKANEVYASDITLDENRLVSGILKANDVVAEKYDNNVSGKNHFLAYVLTVPTANETTVIELNSNKVLKAECGADETNCKKLVWDDEETKSLFVVLGLKEDDLKSSWPVKVTTDGKLTDLSLDLSGIKFQKESEVSSESVLFNEFTDSLYKADLESMKSDKALWNYDYSKNKEYKAEYDKDTKTYKVTGNLAKMEDVKAYPGEDYAHYYFTFAFKLDVAKYPNLTVTTQRTGNAAKSFSAADMENGILTILQNVKDNKDCTNEKCTSTVTIDLDGPGAEYLPTTYTIDYSDVTLGAKSSMKVETLDGETYLKLSYNYEPTQKIDFEEITPNVFTANVIGSDVLAKDINEYDLAGFTDPTGYYLAYKLHIDTTENMRNNDNIVIKAKNGTNPELTYNNTAFDNDNDIYVLAMIDPEHTAVADRKIVFTVDIDGAGTEYAEQTYTIDWSQLKFKETSAATLGVDTKGLTYKSRKLEGTISETEEGNGTYIANIKITPRIKTILNGTYDAIPEDCVITVNGEPVVIDHASNTVVVPVELDANNKNTAKISITVDLDGDGEVFEACTYDVTYKNVIFTYFKNATVRAPKAGEITPENTYGLDISTVGNMEMLNTKDEKGADLVYVKGYALETGIDATAYGVTKGYFLPISMDVVNAAHLTKITLTKGALGDSKNYSTDSVNAVKESGVFTLIRLLSTDGSTFKDSNSFTLTFTYDDNLTKNVKFDLSGVKFGYAAMYADAYEKTMNSDYSHEEQTAFKFGSNDDQTIYSDLIDYMTILAPKNIAEYSTIVSEDGLTHLKLQINPGIINPMLKKVGLDGSGEYVSGGLFKSPVYFDVAIDENGYIVSFDAQCSSEKLNTHPQFHDSDTKEYVVESVSMHYELSGHVAKTEATVEFDDDESLESQATKLKNTFYGKISNDKTLSDLSADEFKQVYTKVGTVNNPSLTEIKIGDRVYDNKPTYISVGNGKYLYVPVFVVVKDELWVSNVHLMAEYYPTVKVVYDNFTYEVPTSVTEQTHTIEIDSVAAINPSDTNKVSEPVFDKATGRWVITHTSASGSNMIGIKLKVDGELINTAGEVIYRINDDAGDMGVTVSEDKGGTVYAYTAYTAPYDGPVNKVSRNSTLIVPGKGIIKIRIDVIPVEAE